MNTALQAHLADLVPVLRQLNAAARQLAASLPGPAHPVSPTPSVDEALADINAAIDAYCAVSIEHSDILGPETPTAQG